LRVAGYVQAQGFILRHDAVEDDGPNVVLVLL
jgi:hypothetical protein